MGDLVSGAVVGAAFAELLALVKDAVKTTIMFRSRLTSLHSILQYINPIIKEIDSLNKQLDRPNEEMKELHDLLERGKVLVKKSSSVKANLWNRYRYSVKLKDLEDDIIKFFQIYTLVNARDNKEALVGVKEMLAAIRRLSSMLEDRLSIKEKSTGGPQRFESIAVRKSPEFVVGLEVSIRELKNWLLVEGVSTMVVSAPGGCGKTTLVETLCNDNEIKGKFKSIFFVTASQSPDFSMLVQSIFNHKGWNVPQIETEEDVLDELQKLLQEIGKHPILLVLDDVWSDSESLVEKFQFNKVQDYKILVTSRFELSKFGTPHKLNPLNHEDARKLFLRSALPPKVSISSGPKGSSFRSHSSIKMPRDELIDEIVKRCKGSPLALTVVGKSLCGKHPDTWKSTMLDWSEGGFVDANKAIFDCLRRSVNDLEGTPYQECFMDLGSFPEDHTIPATSLIDMWIELHELDKDGVHAKGILHELAARNLLDLIATKNDESEGDGYYNDLYVKQHDLLRELAIHENSQGPIQERKRLNLEVRRNKFPNWFTLLKDQTTTARLLSICTDETFSVDWPDLDFPNVEVLVMNFRTKNYTLPPFIKKMANLKTLIIANNGFIPAKLSNFDILGSLPSLKRLRLECIKIPSTAPSISIDSLQKASFFMCDLKDNLMAMPNLEEIDISYCGQFEKLPPGFCNIASLRKIGITSCHKLSSLPNEIGNLTNLEVLRLSSCLNLSGLPGSIGKLKNLAFLDICDCFSITKLPNEIRELTELKELHMKGCLGLTAVPGDVVHLGKLKYVFCDAQSAELWRYYKKRLSKMELKIVQEDISLNWLLK